MDELAAEAGITKPILYSHFGDRAGLGRALADRNANRLIATLRDTMADASLHGDSRDVVSSAFEAFCTFVEKDPEVYRFLVQSSLDEPNPVTSRLVTGVAAEVARMIRGGLRLADKGTAPSEPWAFAIVGMGFVGAEWWLERQVMSKDELVGYLTELVWGGLAGAGFEGLQLRDLT
jgi:AcrR family transcriptional regulator